MVELFANNLIPKKYSAKEEVLSFLLKFRLCSNGKLLLMSFTASYTIVWLIHGLLSSRPLFCMNLGRSSSHMLQIGTVDRDVTLYTGQVMSVNQSWCGMLCYPIGALTCHAS